MSKKVKTTIEVLGKAMSREEALALYYELQSELCIAPLVTYVERWTQPVYPLYPAYPYEPRWVTTSGDASPPPLVTW